MSGHNGEVTIAFIRHGQTDWNRDGKLQGSTDIPLNDTGRQQARDAVRALRSGSWDAIVSSPLSRARETAQIIAAGMGITLGPSYAELVERDYGEGEGATAEIIAEQWPEGDYPGLEPIASVVARGTAALALITRDYPGRNVIVVCHGTLIRSTLSALAGQQFEHILNGSISTLENTDDRWRVLTVNGGPVTPAAVG